MPFRHPEIIVEAGLSEGPFYQEALVYDDVLEILERERMTNRADPELTQRKRRVLPWLTKDLARGPLRVLMTILELDARGRSLAATNKALASYFPQSTNISHDFSCAQRCVRYQMGRRINGAFIAIEHPRRRHLPYPLFFCENRPVYAPPLRSGNWWTPCGEGLGVAVLGSALRLNSDTVLILEQRELVSRRDRINLLCHLLRTSLVLSPKPSLVVQPVSGVRQLISSDIAYVGRRDIGRRSALTVRPHRGERNHLAWTLAEMETLYAEPCSPEKLNEFYGALCESRIDDLFATAQASDITRIFVIVNGKEFGVGEPPAAEELPRRLKDNLVIIPDTPFGLDQLLASMTRWPRVERLSFTGTRECREKISDYILWQCGINSAETASLLAVVLKGLTLGQGMNIWLPAEWAALWVKDARFCEAMSMTGRAVNLFFHATADHAFDPVFSEIRKLVGLAAPRRKIHCFLVPTRLDRPIAILEDLSVRAEPNPTTEVECEALLQVLANLFSYRLQSLGAA